MKSLFKAVALITVFSVITRVFGFIFRVYLSRTLGSEALGLYQIAVSVFFVLLTLVSSGMPLVVSKFTAKYSVHKDKTSEGRMISSALIYSLLSSVILCLIIFVLRKPFSSFFTDARCMTILLILLPAIIFQAIYNVFKGAMWGHSNYFHVCLTELLEQIVRMIFCVFLISFSFFSFEPTIGTALSLTISCLFSMIFGMILYFLKGGRLKKPDAIYKEVIKSNVSISGFRTLSSMIQPVIAFIIPLRLIASGYTSSQAISLFGITTGMTLPLLTIPITLVSSLSMALIPDLSKALTENNGSHINNRIQSSLIFSLIISYTMVPVYIGAGDNIGLFFFDNIQSGILLSSAAWLIIPLALTNVTSSILNALGYELKSIKNYFLGAVLLLLSIWFLPSLIGIRALIVGMGICVSISSFLNIRMIKKVTKIKLNIAKPMLIMSAISLPSAALTFFLTNILTPVLPLFFNLAISCSAGALSFLTLCVVFNLVNINSWFIEFKKVKLTKKRIVTK